MRENMFEPLFVGNPLRCLSRMGLHDTAVLRADAC
jgi:hypothetical protein